MIGHNNSSADRSPSLQAFSRTVTSAVEGSFLSLMLLKPAVCRFTKWAKYLSQPCGLPVTIIVRQVPQKNVICSLSQSCVSQIVHALERSQRKCYQRQNFDIRGLWAHAALQ